MLGDITFVSPSGERMKPESMTAKAMCEYIARTLKKYKDIDVIPEKIFNASPTGELYFMFELFYSCKRLEGFKVEYELIGGEEKKE